MNSEKYDEHILSLRDKVWGTFHRAQNRRFVKVMVKALMSLPRKNKVEKFILNLMEYYGLHRGRGVCDKRGKEEDVA